METSNPGDLTTSEPRVPAPIGSDGGGARERDAEPDWLVLRDCPLGGGPRVDLVLLHPRKGVALIDFAPGDADAAGRLRRALDARRFAGIFGGYPPVARAILPADRLQDLGRVLQTEFKAQAPLALAGGDAWVRTARAAIEADDLPAAPESHRARKRPTVPWRATAAVAVAAGCFSGLLMTALPDRGPGHPANPGASITASSGVEDLSEGDVFTALASAEAAADARRGMATEPRETGHVPALSALPREERPEPQPAPALPTIGSGQEPRPAPTEEAHPFVAAVEPPPVLGVGTNAEAAPQESTLPPAEVAAVGHGPPEPPEVTREGPMDAPAAALPGPARVREAAPAPARPRLANQTEMNNNRAPPRAVPVEAGAGGRCMAILARTMVGGTLSGDDRDHLRRGCPPRG